MNTESLSVPRQTQDLFISGGDPVRDLELNEGILSWLSPSIMAVSIGYPVVLRGSETRGAQNIVETAQVRVLTPERAVLSIVHAETDTGDTFDPEDWTSLLSAEGDYMVFGVKLDSTQVWFRRYWSCRNNIFVFMPDPPRAPLEKPCCGFSYREADEGAAFSVQAGLIQIAFKTAGHPGKYVADGNRMLHHETRFLPRMSLV